MKMRTTYTIRAFLAFLAIGAFPLVGETGWAQQPPSNGSVAAANSASPTSGDAATNSASDTGRIVRDPVTGRVYYQQWITETVPVVRWEHKQMTTTVYENQVVNQVVPTNQTVYQPQTQYVLQSYWKGAWNPFQQPTLAYQSKPVTNWVPTTVTNNQLVSRQQVVPKQQTITVPQPITETKTQQRLVQTEIPQNAAGGQALAQPQPQPLAAYTAGQPRALFNIPLLARQPFPPPQPAYTASSYTASSNPGFQTASANGWTSTNRSSGSSIQSTYTNPVQANQFAQSQYATNQYASPQTALRPVSRMVQTIFPPSYNAPMRTASGQGGSWNQMQNGMTATVLR